MRCLKITPDNTVSIRGERYQVHISKPPSGAYPHTTPQFSVDGDKNIITIYTSDNPSAVNVGEYAKRVEEQYRPRRFLAILFHIYQPPTQSPDILQRIVSKCYLPVTDYFARANGLRATFNVNHSLVELLLKHGHEKVIDNLGQALQRGSIEITGSLAYHPIGPVFLSRFPEGEYEVRRQIELNDKLNRQIFGSLWNPQGFFPPELAFSREFARVIKEAGFKWSITESLLYNLANPPPIPNREIGTVDGLPVFFRSDEWSNNLSQKFPNEEHMFDLAEFARRFKRETTAWYGDKSGVVTLAFDGETFGEHQPYTAQSLDALARECMKDGSESLDGRVEPSQKVSLFPVKLSDVVHRFDRREVDIVPGSWATFKEDVYAREYFPLWAHSCNPIHQLWLDTIGIGMGAVHEADRAIDGNVDARALYEVARSGMDHNVFSCTGWYANRLRDKAKWDSGIIRAGFRALNGAITPALDALDRAGYNGNKIKANGLNESTDELRAKIQSIWQQLEIEIEREERLLRAA